MNRTDLLALCVVLSSACVADLELDTDGPDGTDTDAQTSSTGFVETPPTEGAELPDVYGDIEAWAQDYAQRRCDALYACGCDKPGSSLDSTDTCVEDVASVMAERARFGLAHALPLSSSCLMELESLADPTLCGVTAPPAAFAGWCSLFDGPGQEGEACEETEFLLIPENTCADGLTCLHGICTAPPELGSPCLEEEDIFNVLCDGGAYCSDAGTCEPLVGEGGACSTVECKPGLECSTEGLCEAVRATGAACTYGGQCVSQFCTEGTCDPPAPVLCGPFFWER